VVLAVNRITIGVAAYREDNELTFGKLLAMPFREQREWATTKWRDPRAPAATGGKARRIIESERDLSIKRELRPLDNVLHG